MCAINPKHQQHFLLSFYTSHGTWSAFDKEVCERLIKLEQEFNETGVIRVHVKPYDSSEE